MREPFTPEGPPPRKRRRPKRLRARRAPDLTINMILEWADAHFARTGKWPVVKSGRIVEAPQQTWIAVENALRAGTRGLPGGSSLARLLQEKRGRRNERRLPDLSVEQILGWAERHRARTGIWPMFRSGPVADAPGETWSALNASLSVGSRGLPGGSSLYRLLVETHGIERRRTPQPPFIARQVVRWAKAFHRRHGRWPRSDDGKIPGARGESWLSVHRAIKEGRRGFPGGSILSWAKAHRARHGRWPTSKCGRLLEAPGETWSGINYALRYDRRGLRVRVTLAQLLTGERS